jgi:hypothetical protein
MNQNLLQKIINTNLDFVVNEILPLIEKDYARTVAMEVVDRLKQTVVVLTDDVPGNKEQVNLIWGTIASDPQIVEAVRNALLEAISKINDTKIKAGLTILVAPVTQTLSAITDSVKPDGDQLEKIWKDFLESPEFLAFVISNIGWVLSKIIKDKNAVAWIERIINAFLIH